MHTHSTSLHSTALTSCASPRHPLTGRCTEPALKRPLVKPRKSTNLRKAFSAADDDDDEPAGVVTPKRSNVAKVAIQRNAAKRAVQLPPRRTSDRRRRRREAQLQFRRLNELKASTPSTPADFASASESEASCPGCLECYARAGSLLQIRLLPRPLPGPAGSLRYSVCERDRREEGKESADGEGAGGGGVH